MIIAWKGVYLGWDCTCLNHQPRWRLFNAYHSLCRPPVRAIHCDWPAWPWSGCQPSSKRPQIWWRRPREWALAKRSLHSPQSNSADVAGLRAAARNRCEQVKLAALLNRCLACSSLGVDSAHGCMLRSAGTRQRRYPSTRPSEAVQSPQSSNRYQKIGSPPPFEGDKVCGLLLGCRSPAKNDNISPLLLFTIIVLMKSLLTLNLAAMAPSPSIAVKKTLSLLRAIGLSAGLVASAATMSSVHAATGQITATGNVPATCSIEADNISMTYNEPNTLNGLGQLLISTNSTSTLFSLAQPSIVVQPQGSNLSSSNVSLFITIEGLLVVAGGGSKTLIGSINSESEISANINGNGSLKPGNYEISSVLTCTAQ